MTEKSAELCVVVCDDHPIFRHGLKAMLAEIKTLSEFHEAGHWRELKAIMATQAPRLVLLDIFLPGLEPETSIQDLKKGYPGTSVLVVSMLTKPSAVDRLFDAGADGFVAKTLEPQVVQDAVREVLRGERPIYLPPEGRNRELRPGDNPTDFLPARQAQVLHLICLGMSNKEMAMELGLSASTVRAHVSALFSKLNVANRTEAASYGIRYGILAYTGNHRHYCDLIGPDRKDSGSSLANRPPPREGLENISS